MSTQRALLNSFAVHVILVDFGIRNSALVAQPLTCCVSLVRGGRFSISVLLFSSSVCLFRLPFY